MSTGGRINVLLFSNEPAACGGAEEHMVLLARSLCRERFRIVVACPPVMVEKLGSSLPRDAELETHEFYSPLDIRAALQFASCIRRHRIHILHSHMFHASMVASPIARLMRVPVTIETPHVREHWRKGWKRSYLVDRFIARTVDAFIAVSQANAAFLRREKRISAKKVHVITNGIDTERFRPGYHDSSAFRQQLGISDCDPIVVVLARLEPQKGHAVLLSALPMVCRRIPGVRLLLVGEGSLREELETQAESLGISQNVFFVGHQRNIPEWLKISNFTVLPSFYEGLPLAVLESLAAGKPVIATAVDGTPEVVLDGRTGLLVRPGDASALADAMCRLLTSESWAEQLGQAGRQWIVDHFSLKRQIQETERLYLELYALKHRAFGTSSQSFEREFVGSSRQ